ncbi:hypothetical protein CN918_31735 [Priestia megaterium]|nr:hypothetical protein CN918_31735 [Priestia megaterium]
MLLELGVASVVAVTSVFLGLVEIDNIIEKRELKKREEAFKRDVLFLPLAIERLGYGHQWKKRNTHWTCEQHPFRFYGKVSTLPSEQFILTCYYKGMRLFEWSLSKQGELRICKQSNVYGPILESELQQEETRFIRLLQLLNHELRTTNPYLTFTPFKINKPMINEDAKKEIKSSQNEILSNYFATLYNTIYKLQEEKEWLDDEDIHLLDHTLLSSLKQIENIISSMPVNKRAEQEKWMRETKATINERLEQVQERIQERKIKELTKQVRVIRTRL